METESSKKMAAALQLQADALVKEAVAAQLNTLLQNIGASPADHPVRKEMDRQVGELLGIGTMLLGIGIVGRLPTRSSK